MYGLVHNDPIAHIDLLGLEENSSADFEVTDCKVLVVVGHNKQVDSFVKGLSSKEGFEQMPIGCVGCAPSQAEVDGPDINDSIHENYGNRQIRSFPRLPRDFRMASNLQHLGLGMGDYRKPSWISSKDWATNRDKHRAWTMEAILKVAIWEALQLCRERACDSVEVRVEFLRQTTYSPADMKKDLEGARISWPFQKGNFIRKGRGYTMKLPCARRSHFIRVFGFEEDQSSDADSCRVESYY